MCNRLHYRGVALIKILTKLLQFSALTANQLTPLFPSNVIPWSIYVFINLLDHQSSEG